MLLASLPLSFPFERRLDGLFPCEITASAEPSLTKCVYEIEVDSDLREIMIVDKDIQDAVNSTAMNRYAKILL